MHNIHPVSLVRPRIDRKGNDTPHGGGGGDQIAGEGGDDILWGVFNFTLPPFIPFIVLSFLLLLLQVSQGLAQEKEIVLTPHDKMLLEQAPKTPEELLASFKEFLEHPETDIFDFVEQITGVNRSYWIAEGNGWQRVPCLNPDFDLMITGSSPREDLPCSKCDIKISSKGEFDYLDLRGINPTLTPAKIIAAFGKPKKVGVTLPWGYSYSPPGRIFYGKRNEKYYVKFSFLPEEQLKSPGTFPSEIFENVAYNPNDPWTKKREDLRHYLRQYDNHKDFKPYEISITTR